MKKLYAEYVADPVFEAFRVPVKRSKDSFPLFGLGVLTLGWEYYCSLIAFGSRIKFGVDLQGIEGVQSR